MTEWMLWIAVATGPGDALVLNRYETQEQCQQVRQQLLSKLSDANGGELPIALVHECSEVEKQR